jgi:phosphohistidine phosphatase
MRRLLLLRHAKTENDAPTGQDQDRRLDDRGRLDAAAIGGWIGRHPPYVPDPVLVSPAARAQQTWEIVRDAIKTQATTPRVEFHAELYGADPAQLLQIIRMAEATDPQRMMVVGHNPGMHELALALAGSGDAAAKKALDGNLPTAGLAILDFAIEDWNEVAFRRGTLVRFTSPKWLKQGLDD